MNKGNTMVITIVVVCVLAIAAIFLYSRAKNNATQEEQGTSTEYTFDLEDMTEEEENVTKEEIAKDIAQDVQVATKITETAEAGKTVAKTTSQVTNASPQTGPGEVAGIIALISASVLAFFVYKKQQKTNL